MIKRSASRDPTQHAITLSRSGFAIGARRKSFGGPQTVRQHLARASAGPDQVRGPGVYRSGTCPSSCCCSTTEWMTPWAVRSSARSPCTSASSKRSAASRLPVSARLRPSGHGRLAALPHVGGDAELRTRLPPHGLAAATPGRRPEMLGARRLRCEPVIGSSLSVVTGSDFCGLLSDLWTRSGSTWFSHMIVERN